MTAMREASASADPLSGATVPKSTLNDRKFAFLNQITRPDYRSLPNSTATSQSSVPSTPVTIPSLHNNNNNNNDQESGIFREFGAPIATPEDELLDDLEMYRFVRLLTSNIDCRKSEPLLSPRRNFIDFSDERRDSEEKENREEERDETEADTTIREEESKILESDDVEEVKEDDDEEDVLDSEEQILDDDDVEKSEEPEVVEVGEIEDVPNIRMVESAPQLSSPRQKLTPEEEKEAEEIRKMTESFGEPRKAVLERVYDTVGETDDDETETETENEEMEEDVDEDVRRQIAAVSRPVDPMVFGWKSKDKMEKPTSLPLRFEPEAECSTPRRAEFCIEPEDEDSEDVLPAATSSADEGVLQQSLLQLQKQLRKTDVRCSRLEKICEFQQRDIDSLRFEVDWKDKRIEYLQKTLQELETSQSASDATTRSTST